MFSEDTAGKWPTANQMGNLYMDLEGCPSFRALRLAQVAHRLDECVTTASLAASQGSLPTAVYCPRRVGPAFFNLFQSLSSLVVHIPGQSPPSCDR